MAIMHLNIANGDFSGIKVSGKELEKVTQYLFQKDLEKGIKELRDNFKQRKRVEL
jgi:hypothetical protein